MVTYNKTRGVYEVDLSRLNSVVKDDSTPQMSARDHTELQEKIRKAKRSRMAKVAEEEDGGGSSSSTEEGEDKDGKENRGFESDDSD